MVSIELRDWRSVVLRYPLITAFALSLVLHTGIFGMWRVGQRLGWWQHQATWLLNLNKRKPRPLSPADLKKMAQIQAQARQREIPLTFVEVDPAVSVVEAPKEAKYYGAQNSKAANPDAKLETSAPKMDGQQTKMVRTETVPKPKPFPLQPAIQPQPETAPKPQELKKPPGAGPADAGMGEAQPARERPRTLVEARMAKGLTGQQMSQDGGVKARGRLSLDVKATPFGAYDAAFIAAVQQRWYDLLDNSQYTPRSGKVVLEFRMTYDGRITDMKVGDNEVGEILCLFCQKAVLDPAPYPKWPSDMRRVIGQNYREVTFTFYYN